MDHGQSEEEGDEFFLIVERIATTLNRKRRIPAVMVRSTFQFCSSTYGGGFFVHSNFVSVDSIEIHTRIAPCLKGFVCVVVFRE